MRSTRTLSHAPHIVEIESSSESEPETAPDLALDNCFKQQQLEDLRNASRKAEEAANRVKLSSHHSQDWSRSRPTTSREDVETSHRLNSGHHGQDPGAEIPLNGSGKHGMDISLNGNHHHESLSGTSPKSLVSSFTGPRSPQFNDLLEEQANREKDDQRQRQPASLSSPMRENSNALDLANFSSTASSFVPQRRLGSPRSDEDRAGPSFDRLATHVQDVSHSASLSSTAPCLPTPSSISKRRRGRPRRDEYYSGPSRDCFAPPIRDSLLSSSSLSPPLSPNDVEGARDVMSIPHRPLPILRQLICL